MRKNKNFIIVGLLIALVGCVNYSDSKRNFSELLMWQSNGDLVFQDVPEGFVNAVGSQATVVDGSLTGTVLDNGNCQASLRVYSQDGSESSPGDWGYFTTHRNVGNSSLLAFFNSTVPSECSGKSATVTLELSINGKKFNGTISKTF